MRQVTTSKWWTKCHLWWGENNVLAFVKCYFFPNQHGAVMTVWNYKLNSPAPQLRVSMSSLFLLHVLTWAMLVMKKGSHVLKNSPSRTPSVRLALRALRPCLWARRRSLFTDSCGQHSTPSNKQLITEILAHYPLIDKVTSGPCALDWYFFKIFGMRQLFQDLWHGLLDHLRVRCLMY